MRSSVVAGIKDAATIAALCGLGYVGYRAFRFTRSAQTTIVNAQTAVSDWWKQAKSDLTTFEVEFDQQAWNDFVAWFTTRSPGMSLSDLYGHIAEVGPTGSGELQFTSEQDWSAHL